MNFIIIFKKFHKGQFQDKNKLNLVELKLFNFYYNIALYCNLLVDYWLLIFY